MQDHWVVLGGLAGALLLGQLALWRQRKPRKIPPGRLNWAGGVLTNGMLETSILATGQTGSGKSSAMSVLMLELLQKGYGMYAPAAKPDDLPKLIELCRKAGRSQDVIVIDRSGKVSTNFFAELLGDRDNGTESVLLADGLDQLCQCLNRQATGGGEDNAFWQSGSDRMSRANLHLQLLAGMTPTIQCYQEVMQTAPRRPEDLAPGSKWHGQRCAQLLELALENGHSNPALMPEVEQVAKYYTRELPGMADKTRSCFEAVTLGPIDILTKGAVAQVLSNPHPTLDLGEVIRGNKILLTDYSFGRDRGIAVAINSAVKYLIQLRILARTATHDTKPFCLYLDEFSQVTSSYDVEYATLQRSAKGPMICMIQGVEFLRKCYPNDEPAVDTLTGNLAVKVACGPQTPATSRWLCDILGQRLGITVSGSSNSSYDDLSDLWKGAKQQSTGGYAEAMLPLLTPSQLARFRNGGPANDLFVDLLVYAAGADYGGEPFTFSKVRQQ